MSDGRTVREVAAGMLMVGFTGTKATPGVRKLLEAGVAGCVLFARNVPTDEQGGATEVRRLTRELKAAREGVLLAVDQEGGRVARLRGGFTAVPSMRDIGATGSIDLARAAGRVLGREVRWAGFDIDFAPVVDVDTNPANPVIGTRSFGRDPALVSRMATALIRAMQSPASYPPGVRPVAACAKHFPGHGDTAQDSHHHLPRLNHDLARLEAVELPPFRDAIAAGVAGIMSAHVIFSPLDPHYPATMSPAALGAIVRDRFAFDGVLFSDDLEMKAVADHYALEDQLIRGALAGLDVFLICHSEDLQWKAIDILSAAIDRGTIPATRVEATVRRLASLRTTYAGPVPDGLTLAELQAGHATERDLLARLGPAPVGADPTAFRKE